MAKEQIDKILAVIHEKKTFRTEYNYDGYIQISLVKKDSYEVKIESVSFFDQAIAVFYYFDKQELINYINQNSDKIGK
jgi:hypothetical protein